MSTNAKPQRKLEGIKNRDTAGSVLPQIHTLTLRNEHIHTHTHRHTLYVED